uniref:Secreted protein n=1 Tax=Streptomyces sp. NBC_00003 TaxID=2903608 RepID=A0AAU2VHP2_9ACTN
MNTGLKITAFAAALAATFGAAYGVGKGVDPVVAKPVSHAGHGESGDGAGSGYAGHEAPLPGGLQVSEGGYGLDLKTPRVEAGKAADIRFAVTGRDGRPVTAFKSEHGKELHLIVASSDLNVYRHLHPVRAADGTWSVAVQLPDAGGYRVFADFMPADVKDAKGAQGSKGAEGLVLGADLAVSGAYAPKELPAPAATARVEDGYEVSLEGALVPGRTGELKLSVAKDGKPVSDLEPYLGAYGHLVALRSGDLAYLHVHPNDGGPGPVVSFSATPPSAGAYRLFLDFQHGGKVRTAAFTVHVGGHFAA